MVMAGKFHATRGFVRSRHLDDKAGVAAIYGALKAIARAGRQPKQRTTIHISHYEEVGHGAATGFPLDLVELLAIDIEPRINQGQQEVLNPEAVNCFRFFEGRGYRLWGTHNQLRSRVEVCQRPTIFPLPGTLY